MSIVWKVFDRRTELTTPVFSVNSHRARSPVSGDDHRFYTVNGADWVNVLAVTQNDALLMIRQFRHGVGHVTLEIPGGLVDAEEEPLLAAQRELKEETGYSAANWHQLLSSHPNPALQNNRCTTFLATNLSSGEQRLDPQEAIEVTQVPIIDVPKLVTNGTITHALVLVAFYALSLRDWDAQTRDCGE